MYLSSLQVERDIGPVKCAVHNIGANIGEVSIFDTSTRVYSKVFWLVSSPPLTGVWCVEGVGDGHSVRLPV